MGEVGLFAPSYYKQFGCIKGECKHSCCIGWEIDIDDATLQKYASLEGEMGQRIRESISYEGDVHFELSCGRCPHLDGGGLCRIISSLGEDCISEICRLHPRFFNDTVRGREVGLGMSCEEACRIILSSDGYAEMEKIGEAEALESEFEAVTLRKELYSVLSAREKPYSERICEICERFSVSTELLSDGEWREVIESLEYLDEGSRELFSHYSSDACKLDDVRLERAFAYFVYRHTSGAKSLLEFRTGLGLALFLSRLLASLVISKGAVSDGEWIELARLISEEIEYSTDNSDAIISEFELLI